MTVFDDRPELANYDYFPEGVHLRVGNWGELLETPFPPQPALGLIVTRGHQHDANVLAEWIHRPFLFLGMIGSSRKSRMIREGFHQEEHCHARKNSPAWPVRSACPLARSVSTKSPSASSPNTSKSGRNIFAGKSIAAAHPAEPVLCAL